MIQMKETSSITNLIMSRQNVMPNSQNLNSGDILVVSYRLSMAYPRHHRTEKKNPLQEMSEKQLGSHVEWFEVLHVEE